MQSRKIVWKVEGVQHAIKFHAQLPTYLLMSGIYILVSIGVLCIIKKNFTREERKSNACISFCKSHLSIVLSQVTMSYLQNGNKCLQSK